MNLQRLKFAWARGARIQYSLSIGPRDWRDVQYMPTKSGGMLLRIHPDDAHLEYGPLSSALRKVMLLPEGDTISRKDLHAMAARHYYLEERWNTAELDNSMTPDEARMLGLFVVEWLADEGL